MDIIIFFESFRAAMEPVNNRFTPHQVDMNGFFLSELKNLTEDNKTDSLLNMTRSTILFEGFYNHLEESDLKLLMAQVRVQRWEHHFGVPTITFLLSYKRQIDDTQKLFNCYANGERLRMTPWIVHKEEHFVVDNQNNLIVDPNSIFQVEVPPHRETTGIFTRTHNPMGGCTTTPCDPISQRFIEHAAEAANKGCKVLEIGAAFGAATIAAIAKGATVFCNDIDASNLAVVRQRYLASMSQQESTSVTNDDSKLTLLPGALPYELSGLPARSFDAILICRVLHFFTGEQIEESLRLMSTLLTPGGKIYVVCETPFLKNWDLFIPELNKRVEQGVEWPGEITNTDEFDRSGRATTSCKFIHWITKEVLERSILRAGLHVEHAAYINRAGQFPEDLLRPEEGKESVGVIGCFAPH